MKPRCLYRRPNSSFSKDQKTLEKKVALFIMCRVLTAILVYIEQTKWDLTSCLAEHKLVIKNQDSEKSALCEHFMRFDHFINWNNSKILKTEAHYSKPLSSEAWFIDSYSHVMNRYDGDSLSRVYRPLIYL